VTICYELVEQIEQTAANGRRRDAGRTAIAGAYHSGSRFMSWRTESSDVLQIPWFWGRSEDAADRLAALVMLQFGRGSCGPHHRRGDGVLYCFAKKPGTGSAFADVSSPEEQRYYNYLCIAYGGAPISFKSLVTPDKDGQQDLPTRRAVRCQDEYRQILKAFNLWVMPYVDPNLLIRSAPRRGCCRATNDGAGLRPHCRKTTGYAASLIPPPTINQRRVPT